VAQPLLAVLFAVRRAHLSPTRAHSAAEEFGDYNRRYEGQRARMQEQSEHSDLMHSLRNGVDNGAKAWADVLEQLDAGKISPREVKELYHTKDLTPLQRSFSVSPI
jgi:hypothetical protein